jgi:hypothetical protein
VNSSRLFIAFFSLTHSILEIKNMKNITASLHVLSGVILVAGSLLIPVAGHAGNYGDYIPYRLINQSSDTANPGWRVCTYQSLLNQQRINLSIQYACWPSAFQNRVDGQFYDRTS